jgi:DNA-binding MarR family transcriptional regulator
MRITAATNTKKTFAPIPSWLLRRREVSASAKLAYGRLLQYLGKNQSAWPSYGSLADEIGVSRRQAINLVRELEHHELLIRERRRFGSNRYRFPSHEWARAAGEKISPQTAALSALRGETDFTISGETDFTQKEQSNQSKKRRDRWMIEKDRTSVREQMQRIRNTESRHNPETFQTELTPEGRAKVKKLLARKKELEEELLNA